MVRIRPSGDQPTSVRPEFEGSHVAVLELDGRSTSYHADHLFSSTSSQAEVEHCSLRCPWSLDLGQRDLQYFTHVYVIARICACTLACICVLSLLDCALGCLGIYIYFKRLLEMSGKQYRGGLISGGLRPLYFIWWKRLKTIVWWEKTLLWLECSGREGT